jgi:2-polyprenyl-3-methyl-5-hydroxy-6-metoxy-1,4-benzoquinol methylase
MVPISQKTLLNKEEALMSHTEKRSVEPVQTNTAHQDWDVRWQSEQGRSDWIEPEAFVTETIPLLKDRGVESVLDLGCGVGRHAILLAQAGFQVHAVDASLTAVDYVARQAGELGVAIHTHIAEMTSIPLEKDAFDYLLAWNVIYHGDLSVVMSVLSEIIRLLKPGGIFQGTMLSKRNTEIGAGHCIAKDTYINTDRFEKRHPHFYCNAAEVISLFNGFEPLVIKDEEHSKAGSYHWHILAEKI